LAGQLTVELFLRSATSTFLIVNQTANPLASVFVIDGHGVLTQQPAQHDLWAMFVTQMKYYALGGIGGRPPKHLSPTNSRGITRKHTFYTPSAE